MYVQDEGCITHKSFRSTLFSPSLTHSFSFPLRKRIFYQTKPSGCACNFPVTLLAQLICSYYLFFPSILSHSIPPPFSLLSYLCEQGQMKRGEGKRKKNRAITLHSPPPSFIQSTILSFDSSCPSSRSLLARRVNEMKTPPS